MAGTPAEPGGSKHPGLRLASVPRIGDRLAHPGLPSKLFHLSFSPFPFPQWCDGSNICQPAMAEQHSSASPCLPRAFSLERKVLI